MNVKGKFYIRLDVASPKNYYWKREIGNFVDDPKKASFFDSRPAAAEEAVHASFNRSGAVEVCEVMVDMEIGDPVDAKIVALCKKIMAGYEAEKSGLDDDMIDKLVELGDYAEVIAAKFSGGS